MKNFFVAMAILSFCTSCETLESSYTGTAIQNVMTDSTVRNFVTSDKRHISIISNNNSMILSNSIGLTCVGAPYVANADHDNFKISKQDVAEFQKEKTEGIVPLRDSNSQNTAIQALSFYYCLNRMNDWSHKDSIEMISHIERIVTNANFSKGNATAVLLSPAVKKKEE